MATGLKFSEQRPSLLSSQARIQVPWIKVTIGNYTFGVFSKQKNNKNINGFSQTYRVTYPNYIQSLEIVKINGQVNQYTLQIDYPITSHDDPNFFEKVFSSVSKTRKIVFTYGDAALPTYIYKDEEAIITQVNQSFNLTASVISYTVSAVSGAILAGSGTYNFVSDGQKHKPSDLIKGLFDGDYGLSAIFTAMDRRNLDKLIAGDDQAVVIQTKLNTSVLDYIKYLVGCMVPDGKTIGNISNAIYILTLHDDTTYDRAFEVDPVVNDLQLVGPYFKVTRTSYLTEQSDAYNIDVGYNTATIVSNFQINKNENYSIFYDYQKQLNNVSYVRRLNSEGNWEDVYAPAITSNNVQFETRSEDISWMTKITKYPISATITIQGLLRPATLMSYVRLNVVFPGGNKHISSGLYLVTRQVDRIDGSGYKTTLSLTRISGDNGELF